MLDVGGGVAADPGVWRRLAEPERDRSRRGWAGEQLLALLLGGPDHGALDELAHDPVLEALLEQATAGAKNEHPALSGERACLTQQRRLADSRRPFEHRQ